MLTQEERDQIRMGALAQELKDHAGWSAYVSAVASLKQVYLPRALASGQTDYEKGAVFAMDLVLTCLDATIERREALLAREAKLGAEDGAERDAEDDESEASP